MFLVRSCPLVASVFITTANKGSEEKEHKELNICIGRRSRTDSRVRRTWALIPVWQLSSTVMYNTICLRYFNPNHKVFLNPTKVQLYYVGLVQLTMVRSNSLVNERWRMSFWEFLAVGLFSSFEWGLLEVLHNLQDEEDPVNSSKGFSSSSL